MFSSWTKWQSWRSWQSGQLWYWVHEPNITSLYCCARFTEFSRSTTVQRSGLQLMKWTQWQSCPLCPDLQLCHGVHELKITPLWSCARFLELTREPSNHDTRTRSSYNCTNNIPDNKHPHFVPGSATPFCPRIIRPINDRIPRLSFFYQAVGLS